jgi:hypothetical protein
VAAWKNQPDPCFELIEHTVSSATCLNDVAAFLVGRVPRLLPGARPADIEVLWQLVEYRPRTVSETDDADSA